MNFNAASTSTAYADATRASESSSPFFSGTRTVVKISLNDQMTGYSATEPGCGKRTAPTDNCGDDCSGWDN